MLSLALIAPTLLRFVDVFFTVYILLILAYVLTSWITMPSALRLVQRFLDDVCEPYIRIFRRVLPSLGPLDLSPMVAVISLVLAQRLLVGLIGRLL
ncbi:MAG: YggT family protein [Thermoleophilia bacterium]|nr:YggT family protein [Thermoleophilia bacterium]